MCAASGCKFSEEDGAEYCYCHSRGINPPLTKGEHVVLNADQIAAYKAKALEEARRHQGLIPRG